MAPSASGHSAGGPSPTGQDEPADPEPKPRIYLDLIDEDEAWGAVPDREMLIRAAVAAVATHPASALTLLSFLTDARPVATDAEAVVVLTTDDEVAALNHQFRGKLGPTNVLSFPAPSPPPGANASASAIASASASARAGAETGPTLALGDIVLAAETVFREAREMATKVEHHLQHLVVHGLLHLLDYDHLTAEDADAMERLETDILAALDVPDPYAGSEPEAMSPVAATRVETP